MAAQESSASRHVLLQETGQYVEFTATALANRLVLRYSIPENSRGVLDAFVNGESRRAITLLQGIPVYPYSDPLRTHLTHTLVVEANEA